MDNGLRGMFSVQGFSNKQSVSGDKVILSDITFDRIDLVDFGANFDVSSHEGSYVLLAKRADRFSNGSKNLSKGRNKGQNKDLNKDGGSFSMTEKNEKNSQNSAVAEGDTEGSPDVAVSASQGEVEILKSSLADALSKCADLERKLEEEVHKSFAVDSPAQSSSDDTENASGVDIWKNAPAGLRAEFEKQSARLEEAESIAKRERDLRIRREYLEKARSYEHIPYDSADLSDLLRESHVFDEKLGEKVENFVKSVDISFAEHQILSPSGASVADVSGSSAYEKISKMASALVSAGSSSDLSGAMVKVLEENPNLYDEYREEVK